MQAIGSVQFILNMRYKRYRSHTYVKYIPARTRDSWKELTNFSKMVACNL